jgi:bis(5'-nucleosyl)-tetraphosphatase (symmetrical)
LAVYAIGDIQGCYKPFRKLLKSLHFKPGADQLWLVGDLVNRGPHSLEVLRYVRDLGDDAKVVLGNHDLNLLAVAYGDRTIRQRDTLKPILKAKDCDELLTWLRQQPLLHHDKKLDYTMVHAGLPPQWDLKTAKACAAEVEKVLSGKHFKDFLRHMYGDQPQRWSKSLSGWSRLRFCTNALTRLRFCTANGRLDMASSGPPGTEPPGYMPWFEVPGRESSKLNLVTGHWSALGTVIRPGVLSLDSGCVWGQHLTAYRLDKKSKPVTVKCSGQCDGH